MSTHSGPHCGSPHVQELARSALDNLFELNPNGAQLLRPDPKSASAIAVPKPTRESRDSSVEFDYSQESPQKDPTQVATDPAPRAKVVQKPVPLPNGVVPKWREFTITLGLFTPQATTGPVRANAKTKWITQRFPITKHRINISNHSIAHLKTQLLTIADKVRKDESGGMSALFKTADVNKELTLGVYITNHSLYGKGKLCVVSKDEDLKIYFEAVDNNLGSGAGISWTMENPSKAAQSAIEERSLAHAVLKAQNVVKGNGPTPDDDLAHSDPIPKRKLCLNQLVTHQKAIGNKALEGYRIINPDDNTKIMNLGFEHMIEWAKALAKGTAGVTLDMPPKDAPGFKWQSIKRSLVTTTPLLTSKRTKGLATPTVASMSGYAAMQGLDIPVDFEEARRLARGSTIDAFIAFAKVPEQDVDTVTEALEDHRVQSFYPFLFPEAFNARDMARWGIPMGLGLDLMDCARRFYEHLVKKEETRGSQVVIPDSEDESDYDIEFVTPGKK